MQASDFQSAVQVLQKRAAGQGKQLFEIRIADSVWLTLYSKSVFKVIDQSTLRYGDTLIRSQPGLKEDQCIQMIGKPEALPVPVEEPSKELVGAK